jgi:phenylpropionate dioxygenase-like ring-hydroxylating dioxygenase large terminal subunit
MRARENELLTRIGPGTPMGALYRRFWTPALLSEELKGPDCPPVRVKLLGENLVAFRDTSGHVGLLDGRCPHRRAELFFGRNEEGGLRCAYHGWKFGTQGNCLDMPTEAATSTLKDRVFAKAYPTAERGGIIWAYMGPKELKPELPKIEYFDLPASQVYASKCLMECNHQQAMEGSMDTAHLTFLHRSLKPTAQSYQALGVSNFGELADGDGMPKFFVSDTDYGMRIAARREAGPEHYYWRISQWFMPHSVFVAADPDSLCRGNVFVPIDDENCWWYRVRWHPTRAVSEDEIRSFYKTGDYAELIPGTYAPVGNRSNDYLIDRADQRTSSYSGIKTAQLQDIAVQESQGRIVDRTEEHLGTTDAAIVRCRRKLLEAAAALERGVEPEATRKPEVYKVRAPTMLLKRELPLEEGIRELAV